MSPFLQQTLSPIRASRPPGSEMVESVTLDSVRVALRGILANRLRSVLTMLGILIGTASVIMLVAVGSGISDGVQAQIRQLGTNAVYVLPERTSRRRDNGGTNSRAIRL